ncbi:hypothetical protein HK405_007835 [Cladochytrium tenue]|nr:hypothetical protein HK405_007835 [Cladochytrium tenue]
MPFSRYSGNPMMSSGRPSRTRGWVMAKADRFLNISRTDKGDDDTDRPFHGGSSGGDGSNRDSWSSGAQDEQRWPWLNWFRRAATPPPPPYAARGGGATTASDIGGPVTATFGAGAEGGETRKSFVARRELPQIPTKSDFLEAVLIGRANAGDSPAAATPATAASQLQSRRFSDAPSEETGPFGDGPFEEDPFDDPNLDDYDDYGGGEPLSDAVPDSVSGRGDGGGRYDSLYTDGRYDSMYSSNPAETEPETDASSLPTGGTTFSFLQTPSSNYAQSVVSASTADATVRY